MLPKVTPKIRILVVTGTYLPGIKGGGPIQSIAAIAHHLGDHFDLFIVCRDRDFGDSEPYPDIRACAWTYMGNAYVMYTPPKHFTLRFFCTILHDVCPDVLYLNSVFSFREGVLPGLAAELHPNPITIVVAPRGQLDSAALSLKRHKKQFFLHALRTSRLPNRAIWQATTELEARNIKAQLGEVAIRIAPNLPFPSSDVPAGTPIGKTPGQLRILFISRISPMKNLPYLLDRIAVLQGHVHLTIAGPIEEHSHWNDCRQRMSSFPKYITTEYIGPVTHDMVPTLMAAHHIFALPTLGENFGHAIVEALYAGCPVVISDRTPWTSIEQLGAGKAISLAAPQQWETALQRYCDMDHTTLTATRSHARYAIRTLLDVEASIQAHLALFSPTLPS